MDLLAAIRLISILGVVLIASLFQSQVHFIHFVWIISLAHYLVGAIHSRKHIFEWLSSARTSIPLGLSLITWSLLLAFQVEGSALVSFLIHHISGEAVPYSASSHQVEAKMLKPLRLTRFFWYLSGFLICLRNNEPFRQVPSLWLLTPAAAGFILLAPRILKVGRDFADRSRRQIYFVFEGAFAATVIASMFFRFDVYWLVLFHVILWTLVPLHASDRTRKSHVAYVLAPMLVLTFVIWSFTEGAPFPWSLRNDALRWHFQFWGHLHHGFTYFLFFMNRVPILRPWLKPLAVT